jgi:uncharacterized protein
MKSPKIATWSLVTGALLVCAACKQNESPVPSAEPVQTSVAALKVGDSALRQLTSEQLAERLIQASAGDKLGIQIFDQIMGQFAQSGMVKPELIEKLRAKTNPGELVKLIVPVYTKHLTNEEMAAMIDFYESPTGKSVVSKLPLIAQESLVVGQTWGANLAQSVAFELQNAAAGAAAPGAPGFGTGSAAKSAPVKP